MTDSKKWFVRRTEQVQGPFTGSILMKLAKLGRLKQTDELSNDKELWKLAGDYPQLFKGVDTDLQLKDEERNGLDRREEEHSSETSTNSSSKRQGEERRQPEPEEEISRRKGRTRLINAMRESRVEDHFPFMAIIASIVLIVILGIVLQRSDQTSVSDCQALPKPEVNWDDCSFNRLNVKNKNLSHASIKNAKMISADLQGAILEAVDFSYTDLSKGNLKNSNLDKAILKGTNLKSVNLTSASLKGADLSYADLSGAKLKGVDLSQAILDKAIWIDGKLCAKGSIGRCIKM